MRRDQVGGKISYQGLSKEGGWVGRIFNGGVKE